MKNKKELEDVLKNKFSELELDSTSGSWEKLSQKLDEAPVKRPNYSFLLVASLVGVLLTIGIFMLVFNVNTRKKEGVLVIKKYTDKKEGNKLSSDSQQVNETMAPHKIILPEKNQIAIIKEKNPELIFRTEDTKQEYILPDSSKVILNKYSKINVSSFKESGRSLNLIGEAFFEVKNKKDTPFTIICGRSYIEVVGTSFNIKSYGEDSVEVFVQEGKVKFGQSNNFSSFIFLLPGDRAIFDNKNIKKYTNTDANYLLWKTNLLTFNNTRISDAIKTMQEYFHVKINVAEPTILNCHLSGKFKNPDLKTLFAFLGRTLEIEYVKEGNEYFLKGKGCKINE
jgi:hypothetical protein